VPAPAPAPQQREPTPVPSAVPDAAATAPVQPATPPTTPAEPPVASDATVAVPHPHKDEAPSPATPATASAPAKKGPNHFVITVSEKTPAHPAFGTGHPLGLNLDGVPGKTVVLRRGESYEFEVSTDPKHDVYFSTSPLGWGGGVVSAGIKGQFTYRGSVTVSPDDATPDVMYYQCRNHSSMGGKVIVVNKSTPQAEIDKLLAEATTQKLAAQSGGHEAQKEIPVDAARQKIMLAEMMLQSKGAKAVAEGGEAAAKSSLSNAVAKIQGAKQEISAGNGTRAAQLADEALQLVSAATKSASKDEAAKQQRARYTELRDTLHNFQESHRQNYERTVKKRGKSAAVDYDHAKVDALVNEAQAAADKGQYNAANDALIKAERLVTQAIGAMLDAQTIVYDLNFDTPADEYAYELKRFASYEELIPVAIEEKRPAESVVKLMDTYVAKGRSQRDEAVSKAKSGNYPDAISMLLSATEEIRRALRLAGVSQ
jgi:hypothetical protein